MVPSGRAGERLPSTRAGEQQPFLRKQESIPGAVAWRRAIRSGRPLLSQGWSVGVEVVTARAATTLQQPFLRKQESRRTTTIPAEAGIQGRAGERLPPYRNRSDAASLIRGPAPDSSDGV